jgi:hypothetical protein
VTVAAADFDQIVESIVHATGVDRARAAEIARTNGFTPDELTLEQLAQQRRDARILEAAEQKEVIKVFREHGCTVRSTSQYRPSKVSIGLPDLFCAHHEHPIAFWWETKRQVGGVVSEAQRDFAADCQRCGIKWYSGDRYDAERVCRELGFSRRP